MTQKVSIMTPDGHCEMINIVQRVTAKAADSVEYEEYSDVIDDESGESDEELDNE